MARLEAEAADDGWLVHSAPSLSAKSLVTTAARVQSSSKAMQAVKLAQLPPARPFATGSSERKCMDPPAGVKPSASTCSSNHSSARAMADELQELEKSGLRISWPPHRLASPAAQAPAEPEVVQTCTAASRKPEQAPKVTAALMELEELQACGLSVRWPG